MPYINKPKTDKTLRNRAWDHKYYVDTRWKKMRETYLQRHPLCEMCAEEGRTSLATEAHHRVPFNTGRTPEEREQLCYDWNNIQALCHDCHVAAHKELKKIRRNPR